MFWDIPKWNRGQTKWDGGSIFIKYSTKSFDTCFIFYNIEQILGSLSTSIGVVQLQIVKKNDK